MFNDFFELLQSNIVLRDIFIAMVGLAVGSFLNVVALRSVQEKSWIYPPSACTHCQHRLGALDLIPVVSYFLLHGRCRYCKGKIAWYYPFVEVATAIIFVVNIHCFSGIQFVGLTIFSCALIALCVTDFKEMLLPHEITYPTMALGIGYSALTRPNGAADALIGVGVCYMLFDYLAFYGLKWYEWSHRNDKNEPDDEVEKEESDPEIDRSFSIEDKVEEEPMEVMGGGDTIIAAVIAAWLGWQALIPALIVGFLAGSVLGFFYLVYEMHQRRVLSTCIKPTSIGATVGLCIVEAYLYFLNYLGNNLNRAADPRPETHPELIHIVCYGLVGAACGALLGTLFTGQRLAKPFPFGPALAFGAFVAMFSARYVSLFGGA